MTRLDSQIVKDLTELYIGQDISDAVNLNTNGAVKGTSFSTRGLPLHFCGNREADTVFVMLNPGENACMADAMFHAKTTSYNRSSAADFIDDYKRDKTKVSLNRAMLVDPFDVKQAAFLKPWKDSGVSIPEHFPLCCYTYWDAVENVLNQKLQLELIPYSSSSFGSISSSGMATLIPFLEMIIDEIVDRKRKYVIFGSAKYEKLFNYYNGYSVKSGSANRIKMGVKCTTKIGAINVSCIPVEFCFPNQSFKAMIACSFPNRALATANSLMEQYGEFCFKNY